MPNQRRDDLVGNGFDIERFGRRTHTRTLDEGLGTTSRANPNIVGECPFLAQSGRADRRKQRYFAGAIEVIEIVGAVSAVTCRGTPLGGRRIQGLTLDEAALRDVRDKSSR